MKFQLRGHSGCGSSHTPQNFVDLYWYDNTPLTFRTTVAPLLLKPAEVDANNRLRLDLTWRHWIFFKGAELLQFHSYSEYYINNIENPPITEELEVIVRDSHAQLRRSFEERRNEFIIFEEMKEIDEDTIQQIVSQLLAFLLPQKQ